MDITNTSSPMLLQMMAARGYWPALAATTLAGNPTHRATSGQLNQHASFL